ncbi:MAG: hypothetical protein RIE58_03335 [Vicingaceae bacterium]
MKNSIFLPKSIEVIICSGGGVGTTFFIEEIKRYKSTNDPHDLDGLKHLPLPPISLNKNLKAIFVLGDPLIACASLFRRDFHSQQSVVMNRFLLRKRLISASMNLEHYAQEKFDGLLFDRQLMNWKTRPTAYDILFVKYEKIHDNLKVIQEFLGLPDEFVVKFPKKIDRRTDLSALTEKAKNGLSDKYGALKNKIDELDDVAIKKGSASGYTSIKYFFSNAFTFTMDYLSIIFVEILKKFFPGMVARTKQIFTK